MKRNNYSILLLLFLFYTQNVLGNRGSGEMILETYKDNSTNDSNSDPPALPQDLQPVEVAVIHNDIEGTEPALTPENNKESPIIPLMDDNNKHNDNENKNDEKASPMQDGTHKKEQQRPYVLDDSSEEELPAMMDNERMPPMFDETEEDRIQIPTDVDRTSREYGSGRKMPPNYQDEFIEEYFMAPDNNNNGRDHRHSYAPEYSNPTAENDEPIEEMNVAQDTIVENTSK